MSHGLGHVATTGGAIEESYPAIRTKTLWTAGLHANLLPVNGNSDDIVSNLVPPHGAAELRPLLVEGDALSEEKRRAEALPRLVIT